MVKNTVPSHLRGISPPPPGLPATLSRGTRTPQHPGWHRPYPSAPRRTWRVWEAGVQSSPKAFCKDPPTSRQPSRRRLGGAGFPSRACATALASTTSEDEGGATSQRSLRGTMELPRVPSASTSADGLGNLFWSYSHAKWFRPGEECPLRHIGLAPG